jgi:sugar phosphate isomerase/epimerase
MHTGISHLAFNSIRQDQLFALFDLGLSNFEIVLSKVSISDFADSIALIKKAGFSIESAQSILFGSGVSDLTDQLFVDYIKKVIPIYESLGVKTLVLGSPSQRVTPNFDKLADSFFQLDQILSNIGITICIEPNSRKYGGNYFFNVQSISNFIDEGNFSNIKTMIDSHNLILEGLDPSTELIKYSSLIHHIHVSEIELAGFVESTVHSNLSRTLSDIKYSGLITYEVLNSKNLIHEVSAFKKCFAENNLS